MQDRTERVCQSGRQTVQVDSELTLSEGSQSRVSDSRQIEGMLSREGERVSCRVSVVRAESLSA
jgi:hypothetical protein